MKRAPCFNLATLGRLKRHAVQTNIHDRLLNPLFIVAIDLRNPINEVTAPSCGNILWMPTLFFRSKFAYQSGHGRCLSLVTFIKPFYHANLILRRLILAHLPLPG